MGCWRVCCWSGARGPRRNDLCCCCCIWSCCCACWFCTNCCWDCVDWTDEPKSVTLDEPIWFDIEPVRPLVVTLCCWLDGFCSWNRLFCSRYWFDWKPMPNVGCCCCWFPTMENWTSWWNIDVGWLGVVCMSGWAIIEPPLGCCCCCCKVCETGVRFILTTPPPLPLPLPPPAPAPAVVELPPSQTIGLGNSRFGSSHNNLIN